MSRKAEARCRRPSRPSCGHSLSTTRGGSLLEPLARSTRREAIAFVAERPYENAFIHWVLEVGHGPHAPDEILLHRDDAGALTGVLYLGTQLVIATDDDAAVAAFAAETRRRPDLRSFVGSRASIERLWDRVRHWYRPPAIARGNQPLYVLSGPPPAEATDLAIRQATLADANGIIENAAEMMLGELGYDPRVNRTSFSAGIRRAITLGQWWVYTDDAGIKFQLNVGARTKVTAQLQGVWTPPPFRKRGYASLALRAIATRLLQTNPSLSLYVNDFNADAIALYERVGFVCVGEMSTLLFA